MSLPVFPSTIRGLTFPVVKQSGFSTIVQSSPNNLEMTVSQARNPRWTWQYIFNYSKDYDIQSGQQYTDYRILQGFLLSLAGAGGEFLYTDPTDNAVGPALISSAPNPLAQLQLVTDGLGGWYSPVQRNFGGQFYEDIPDINGSIAVYANSVLQVPGTGSSDNYTLVGPGLAIPGNSFMGMVIQWNLPYGLITWTAGASVTSGQELLDPNGHIQKVTTAGTLGNSMPVWNKVGGTTSEISPGTAVWTDQGYNPSPATPINAQFSFYFRCRISSDEAQMNQFMQQIWTYGGDESVSGEPLTFKSSPPVQV